MDNYATKSGLKNAAGVDTSQFSKEADLASLKSDVDKLVIGKLETTHADLSNLSNAVEKEVVKKTSYNELVKKVNAFLD